MALQRILLAASLAALAQTVPLVSSVAQQSTVVPNEAGLLVGLSSGRTVWLTLDKDSLRHSWTAPYLVVPRADGYWMITNVERCGLDLDSPHGGGGGGEYEVER